MATPLDFGRIQWLLSLLPKRFELTVRQGGCALFLNGAEFDKALA